MKAVFKKELRQSLTGLIGPLMIAAVTAVIFMYFIFNNLIAAGNDLSVPMNASSVMALTFAVPFLTMRSFSEEKKAGTDRLYMTAPVTLTGVVMGKFLAYALIMAVPACISALLPLVLLPYGAVELLYSYTCILAFYLYALMIIAIGLFISSVTENQFAAGIISLMVILLGVVMNSAYDSIGISWLKTLLKAVFDFGGRISQMMSGVFDWTCVVYFVSVSALFLFLTMQSLLKTRYTLTKKNLSMGMYSLASCVCSIVLVLLVNIGVSFLPDRIRTVDVTLNRLYSITTASKQVLDALTEDVTLYYLGGQNSKNDDENVLRVLEDYAAESAHVRLEYVDTVMNPAFASQYTMETLSTGSVLVVNHDSNLAEAVPYEDMVKTAINFSSMTQYVTGYDAEGCITNAIQLVSAGEDTFATAYITTGHNEISFEEAFYKRFARMGLTLTKLNLTEAPSVPDDCRMLIINAPETDFTRAEADAVLSYLREGGSLLMVMDYTAQKSLPNLDQITAYFGVHENRGIVIETDSDGYYYSGDKSAQFYIFPLVCEDVITQGLLSSKLGSVFVPLSEAFLTEEVPDTSVTPLLVSSKAAFLKKDLTNTNTEMEAGDEEGTQLLALRAERQSANDTRATACFYASSMLFSESANTQVANGMNMELFTNTLNYLAGNQTNFVSVPAKSFYETLTVKASAVTLWSSILVVVVVLIAASGVLVFLRRRRL